MKKTSLWISILFLISLGCEAKTDFIPCSDPCNGGDVNYELVASVRTGKLLNYTYRGRTFSSEGDESWMGPTMHVKPGQSLWIKLRNNLTEELGPAPPTPLDYWTMINKPGEKIKYLKYKKAVSDPSLLEVDWPNIPSSFDATNLHLHGLDVAVHMFDPVGTHSPEAPHIEIEPGQCYCYKFDVPDHHPAGMYWYHPHLHGSSAIQIWSGMKGLIYVDGPLEEELANYGVTNTQEFVIWDPAFRAVDEPTHNLEVDEFLNGQTTLSKIHPFLINGKDQPNFEVSVGEVLHLRALCSTIENENTFIVYPEGMEQEPWDEAAVDFWVIGTDGVTYPRPRRTNIVVFAGGQREEILLQFDKPGKYVISQQGIQGMQFFDMMGHPHDQTLATITVTEGTAKLPKVAIDDMVFTPGYDPEEKIEPHQIAKTETIVFSMGANRNQVPFPQYYVNGKPFSPDRIDFRAQPGEAVEYILINANHNAHPFHIHVNRFQVQEMGTELSTEKYPVLKAVMDFDSLLWRDTVMVPPNGRTRIWVQYKNYTGKTVLHCHFLAHEDTGMMSTLFIGKEDDIFHWSDFTQEIIGVLAGLVLTVAAVSTLRRKQGDQYAPVEMNELKSKAQD